MRTPIRLVLGLTPLAACLPPPLADCSDDGCLETSQQGTSSTSASPTSDAPVHTVTGDDVGTTSSMSESGPISTDMDESDDTQDSSTDAVHENPEIYGFTLSKDQIAEPGEVDLLLDASDDVVEVDIWYGDTMLATLPITAFPYTFDVTSQTMCDGMQTFTVTVRNAEGLEDSEPAELLCQLAAPGSEIYTSLFPGMSSSGGTAVAALPDGAVIVAGVLDGRMALWRLDPDGKLLPNWPKTITSWTVTDGVGDKESTASAVAVDPLGVIVVAGNIKSGFTTQRYLARLNDEGQPLWEDPGLKDGEEISGLAIAATGEIAAGGAVRTNPDDPNPAFDSSTWVYPNGYHPSQGAVVPDVFGQPDTDPVPDAPNERTERARAVVARGDGGFIVFGEREYKDGSLKIYNRATAQRYTNAGLRDGALWTSPGLKFFHDAALAATVTETGFLAAGWCRHNVPNALRQVCVQEFDADGALVGFFAETSPTQAEARAVAKDRELKTVLGGFLSKPGQTDAWVFASRGADQPLAWSQRYNGGDWDFATGVGCDLWGRCTWVGSTVVDGAMVLIVSQRQP